MAEYKLVLPAMGEGVIEATITGWLKQPNDTVEEDESVVEIATDKVDSDVPSPVEGKIIKLLKEVNEVAKVGEAIAIIEVDANQLPDGIVPIETTKETQDEPQTEVESTVIQEIEKPLTEASNSEILYESDAYLSPLVKSIIKEENITQQELDSIKGSGLGNRITKEDIITFLENRSSSTQLMEDLKTVEKVQPTPREEKTTSVVSSNQPEISVPQTTSSSSYTLKPGEEIIEMNRMRKLIADYMVKSKLISPHVTSFIETDVTNLVHWRNTNKDAFQKKVGEKLTFMPLFIMAIIKAIQEYPMINISVDGDTIIKKKNINIGMATALPDGNLIVPVIKNADQYNITGLATVINDLAERARKGQLKPDEITEGTYTITNIGSFGNIMGTPIINQPQVAIMAVGAIEKKPAVVETPQGDMIGIRHKMFLSHAYDHRVVDGALGGMFLKKVSDYLENWDQNLAF